MHRALLASLHSRNKIGIVLLLSRVCGSDDIDEVASEEPRIYQTDRRRITSRIGSKSKSTYSLGIPPDLTSAFSEGYIRLSFVKIDRKWEQTNVTLEGASAAPAFSSRFMRRSFLPCERRDCRTRNVSSDSSFTSSKHTHLHIQPSPHLALSFTSTLNFAPATKYATMEDTTREIMADRREKYTGTRTRAKSKSTGDLHGLNTSMQPHPRSIIRLQNVAYQ